MKWFFIIIAIKFAINNSIEKSRHLKKLIFPPRKQSSSKFRDKLVLWYGKIVFFVPMALGIKRQLEKVSTNYL
ncbi:hypothetical protein B0A68_07145 [Flavobacterium reichenbachii]|uniref:Uncharacterized protein n=1 Tax=Flavobacterium reichenbachii TaxID=362418 RepID=A0A085ZLI1_9FLAO|nr:hypothetical protein IW19_07005 [Flavobacterium reichenbachii]OXB16038.1 hypothetical protein B0A68_07145 [Flavobacterium reichenbachii]